MVGAFEDAEAGIRLPHLIGTITNLDGSAIQRSLMSIQSELIRRQRVFNETKNQLGGETIDIYAYQKLFRAGKVAEPMPHLFIISDEFAELKQQQPDFMEQLISAARIGRSLGIHLILATHKPSGVVNDQIRSNAKFKVCLKVQDKSDSMDMLLRPEAAELKDVGRFYLQVGYTAPHAPWLNNHPEEYTRLYEDCPFESCPMEKEHPDSIYLTKEVMQDLRANQIGYYAAVTAMDAGIGRIIEELERLGVREDTLVIFSSDNGFSCGHHGFWGKGNGTFPINMYESSVKVPFIASQPGKIPVGVVNSSLVSAYDFMPTILEYVGVEHYETEGLPGRSFLDLLMGGTQKITRPVVVFDEYGPNRMIRGERYKLIKRYPYGPNELYDLKEDPGERNNLLLVAENGAEEIRQKLDYELESWFLQYVNPEIDGAKEAVYGSGQINLAGLWSHGETSHSCDDYIKEKLEEKDRG